MNRLINLYILVALLILGVALIELNFPGELFGYFSFNVNQHRFIESINAVIILLIAVKANDLFTKTQDKRMLIFAGAFVSEFIFRIFHIAHTDVFPYDVLTRQDIGKNVDLIYLLIGDIVTAIAIFVAAFLSTEENIKGTKKTRFRIYLTFVIITLIIILSDLFLNNFFQSLYSKYPYIFDYLDSAIETADKALYILSAFIFADMFLTNKRSIFRSKFIWGLIILGVGQLFFTTPIYLAAIFGFSAHILRILGDFLLFLGLGELLYTLERTSIRQKLTSYLFTFLITSYFVFVVLGSALFNFRFPAYAPFIYLEFFVIASIIQYFLSSRFIIPILNIYDRIKNLIPGQKPVEIPVISRDEVGVLTSKINELVELSWEYTQELIKRQEQDKIRFSIINKIRSALNADEVLRGIVNQIGDIFKLENCLIFNYDKKKNSLEATSFEYRKDIEIPSLQEETFIRNLETEEIFRTIYDRRELMIVSDIESSKLENNTKDFLERLNIKSFIILPLAYKSDFLGILILSYYKKVHEWTTDEVELLKSIEPQISTAIYQASLYTSASETAEREAILRRIINLVLTSLDINDVLRTVTKEVGLLFKAEKCVLRIYNSKTKQFEPQVQEYRASMDVNTSVNLVFSEALNEFYEKVFVQQRKILIVDDINTFDVSEEIKNFISDVIGVESFIEIPILHNQELLAVLSVGQTYRREWTKDDIEILIPIADQLAIAIYQSQLFTDTRNLAQREQLLRRLMVSSIGSMDINDILNNIVTQVGQLFGADRCFFAGYNSKTDEYFPTRNYEVYLSSANIKNIVGRYLSKEEMAPFTEIMIKQKRILAIDDVRNLDIPEISRNLLNEYNIKSAIGAPIFYKDTPLGLILLHYTQTYKKFSNDEIEFLDAIASQSAIVIHQAQLYNQIQESRNREALLRTVINEVLTSNNLEEAVLSIVTEVGKIFDADRTVLRFFDESHQGFMSIIEEYRRNEDIPSIKGAGGYPRALDEYLLKEFSYNKSALIVDDIESPEYPDVFRDEFKKLYVKSTMVAPIYYQDKLLAAIILTNTEYARPWNKDLINLLAPVTQQIALGINLFALNERLSKALNNEKILREIIIEVRKFDSHDEIYVYLLEKLNDIFGVSRTLHLHFAENGDMYILNEVLRSPDLKSLEGETLLCAKCTEEIVPKNFNDIIVINNVRNEIKGPELREFLLSKNIESFLLYSTSKISPNHENDSNEKSIEMLGVTMPCSISPRIWTGDEINLFRLIVDAVSIVYIELSQRKEVEEIKRTFIATLTHDLRSPIIAEQKALEFVMSREPHTELGKFSEYLDDIYKTNKELLRIVNNMLTVYHYESGKFELNPKANDITEITGDAVKSLRHLAKDQDSEIIVNIDGDIPPVMIDRNEIYRVTTNLISNAIKHNRKGTKINVEVKRINNEVQVSVRDNGKGIPESERAKIFQRYPTSKREIGTGLGLYLSKQIIDAHNGKIWFDTESGKGTTFYFTVPVA